MKPAPGHIRGGGPGPIPSRRQFLERTGGAATVFGLAGASARAQRRPRPVRVGLVHPVSGFLAFSGNQCRIGALMAIAQANARGGIASLGGAPIEPLLGDAQSKPEVGAAEVERMNEAGAAAIVGAYASSITLTTTQRAARYGMPHIVDVGVSDRIVERGLENTFRFCPGYGTVARTAVDNLVAINRRAGNPARTAVIVHEESLFGTGTAALLKRSLPEHGFEVLDVFRHANPTRDFTNIILKIRALAPDLVIPANYYNEYILFTRTMHQYGLRPKAVYSVLGGTASSYKFLEDFPRLSQHLMDCNHWFDPRDARAHRLRDMAEQAGHHFTYELFLAYSATNLLIDAIERAASADRGRLTEALAQSRWDNHFMPYGPTRFVNGQNTGARPLNTQIIGDAIETIYPPRYATAAPVFPIPEIDA